MDHQTGTCPELAIAQSRQLPALPPDVLVEIFQTQFPSNVGGDPPDNLPLLAASVCHYWRNVVLSTPSAWTSMTASKISRYDPALYLKRSLPYPFNLHLYFDGADSFRCSHFMQSVCRALQAHYKRLEELYIFYRAHDNATLSQFLATLHALDSLNIRILLVEAQLPARPIPLPPYSALHQIEPPFRFTLPPTSRLTFCKIPSRWASLFHPSYMFPALTTLWFTGESFPRFGFCELLKRIPALKTLVIEELDQRAPFQGYDGTSTVVLPLLSNLVVGFHWHPSLSRHCVCVLGAIIAPNLEVLELGVRFEADPNEGELLEFHERNLRDWRKPESRLRMIVFHGALDPWHKGTAHILKLFHKPLDVVYKGFKGKVLTAPPVKGAEVTNVRMVRSLCLDYTQLVGQNFCEALYRLTQMLPLCGPIVVGIRDEMRECFEVMQLRQNVEGVTFRLTEAGGIDYTLSKALSH